MRLLLMQSLETERWGFRASLGFTAISNILLLSGSQFSSVAQSCPTLCNPMDCSLPCFPVHGILQARTLEWVAISFSNAGK